MSPDVYRIGFWVLLAWHVLRTRIYIGPDQAKYDAATFGILIR